LWVAWRCRGNDCAINGVLCLTVWSWLPWLCLQLLLGQEVRGTAGHHNGCQGGASAAAGLKVRKPLNHAGVLPPDAAHPSTYFIHCYPNLRYFPLIHCYSDVPQCNKPASPEPADQGFGQLGTAGVCSRGLCLLTPGAPRGGVQQLGGGVQQLGGFRVEPCVL
jgi:hypothetical protein